MSNQDDVNNRLFEKIDALTAVMSDMRMEVVEMRTELRLRKECPDPGACLTLTKKVEEHEVAIQQARGGWKVIAGAAFSSGALGAVITKWLEKL